jgi:four helix bundle protein
LVVGRWSLVLREQGTRRKDKESCEDYRPVSLCGLSRDTLVGDFKKLTVWQAAHSLAIDVYRATAALPAEERYGLQSQLRRASSSTPANLAEGCGRGTDTELRRFIRISLGSATELEYHLILTKDLGLLSKATSEALERRSRQVQASLARLYQALGSPQMLGGNDQRPTTKDQRLSTSP